MTAARSPRAPASVVGGLRAGRDVRLRALVLTLVAIVGGGAIFAWIAGGSQGAPTASPRGTAASNPPVAPPTALSTQQQREVRQRFTQGVIMLHAQEFDHAVTAFHRVLALAPEIPEAHVNMGFALIGLHRHEEARRFFEGALALRREQVNAYYGLAVALEELNDIEGAVGAMRTYVHLSAPSDPYRAKAMAAVWEWENQLPRARPGASAGTAR